MEKRNQRTWVAFIGLFSLIAVLLAAVGIGAEAADEQVERPFRMETQEYVVDEGPDAGDCSFVTAIVEGDGVATHMGAVEISRSHCFSLSNDPPIYDGEWEAEGADGDKVFGTYQGYMVPAEFDSDGNPVRGEITAQFTISGGTGRFEGATGGGSVTADYDLVADSGSFIMDGTITY